MYILRMCETENVIFYDQDAVDPIHLQWSKRGQENMVDDTWTLNLSKINPTKTNCKWKMLPDENDEQIALQSVGSPLLCVIKQTLWQMRKGSLIEK